jgi:transketolase
MLNPDLKLNPKIFKDTIEEVPTRVGYGEGLLKLGEENPNVVALTADLLESTHTSLFAKKFPERFFECGVAEQNMAGVASGLGISGKIPFIASYATFSPGRNWEQIRTTIAYNDSNVKIAGHHAGISTGADGATHQATEDIAIMRTLPNMKVIVPVDAIEARKATIASAYIYGPVYLRFQREKTPVITTEETPFVPGKVEIFWISKKPQVLIIATGPILYKALFCARDLEKEKIETLVVNCHTIKPLDTQKILELAKKCKAVVTVEEHQIYGGLGGAIAEFLSANYPVPIEFVGLKDTFGESGPPEQLIEKYGLDVSDIKSAVKKVIKRKK